ncbi:CrcB protein [Frigoribacterium sp. PvP120]|uniref:fluoride efflux transporter FluC n=1 Tax=unclassified Frigoribacterium TaxID=2627005 RepID=UPI001AE2289E|nr:CrcB family protein [Frigoribacterium sp. PvP121]MBP1240272.1 CrcB protein [Frigoribacterium sp. PvP121]
MTPLLVAATALAGGVGAGARFWVDGAVGDALAARRSRRGGAGAGAGAGAPSPYPWGTAVINVSGSLLLGLLTALALGAVVSPTWRAVLGTGLLGGYTTFSTASVDTVRLLAAGRRGAGAASALGLLVAGVAAAGLGLWLGSLVASA